VQTAVGWGVSDLCTKCEMSLRCAMGRVPDEAYLCRTCRGIWIVGPDISVRCNYFLEMLRGPAKAGRHTFFGLQVKSTVEECPACRDILISRRVDGYTEDYAKETRYAGLRPHTKPKVLG